MTIPGHCPGCGERPAPGELCCYQCARCGEIGPDVTMTDDDREMCPECIRDAEPEEVEG